MGKAREREGEPQVPLQRAEPTGEAALAEFAESADARRLAELEADRDLLDRLMWSGYQGPEYDWVADRLARYGNTVLRAWCATGAIFRQCASRGYQLPRVTIRREDALELAGETVAVALKAFREQVLIPRKWDPRRGASLTTFFIGQCLHRFPNVYRRWQGENRPLNLSDSLERHEGRNHRADEEARAAAAERIDEMLVDIDEATAELLVLKAKRYTNEEIAELLEMSVAAVRSRLHRVQKEMRRRRDEAAA